MTGKQHEGTEWGDKYILNPDLVGGYTVSRVKIHQVVCTLMNYALSCMYIIP